MKMTFNLMVLTWLRIWHCICIHQYWQ